MAYPEERHDLETPATPAHSDSTFESQVQRLHRLTVYSRWLVVALLWISAGTLSIWALRSEIALWVKNFTWVAVRYSLAYNPLPTLGLALCISMTVSVLVWQSRNILLGMPHGEQKRLEDRVLHIRRQGQTHPLWKWVCCR